MYSGWTRTISVAVAVALAVAGLPATAAAGDNGTDGAAIIIGLGITILVVLGLISLKTDIHNVFGKATEEEPRPCDERLVQRVRLVLEDPEADMGPARGEAREHAERAEAFGLGLRFEF